MLPDFLKFLLTVSGGFLVALLSYNFIEVGKKRKIETYWKIESEYKSETQQKSRRLIEDMEEEFDHYIAKNSRYTKDEIHSRLVSYYNEKYHHSIDEGKKAIAWGIRTRLRFLHLTGILLKKKMIDRELLFGLIGLGFEIDYNTLTIILDAHRQSHNTPYLYNYFEYLWNEYQKWKNNLSTVS